MSTELQRLTEQLRLTRAELDAGHQELARIRRQLAEAERAIEACGQRHGALERQASDLAHLYVAMHRLHETLERAGVLQTIEEIVGAIIGSEELAILERGADGSLSLIAASGVDGSRLRKVASGEGRIGRAAMTGEIYVAKDDEESALPHEKGLTACVPLRLGQQIFGVLAIFRLLPQKQALEPVDHELFELLSSQAAMALHCARLNAQAEQ